MQSHPQTPRAPVSTARPGRYLPAILRALGLVEKADGSQAETIMRYSLARDAAVKEQTLAVGGKEAPIG